MGKENSVIKKINIGFVVLGIAFLVLLVVVLRLGFLSILQNRLEKTVYAPAPENMVLISPGTFFMGSNDSEAEADERPLRKVFVKAFYIDKYEVTKAQYRQFNPDYHYPDGTDNYPVTHITRNEAEAYCRSVGKRLPTGAEWEKAARGTDHRIYPWGNSFAPGLANVRVNPKNEVRLMPVGSFPHGVSPYGVYDMSGNVWEWVTDEIRVKDHFWDRSDSIVRGIVRGGAYRYSSFQARASHQGFEDPLLTCNDIGFRCVKDAKPQQ